MNGTQTARQGKSAPTAATLPAPTTAPPIPSNNVSSPVPAANRQPNGTAVNGTHPPAQKGKKKAAEQVDPSQMYETLKNRIAALEEEEVHEEEEERRIAEEAQDSVSGMGENAIHAKYLELFSELKRIEREHAKEKQKLMKDKDAAKSQLTKANQTKTKMENLARELQKDNKKLREDSKRLAACVEEAQDEIQQMKNDMAKRAERAKIQETKYRETPDIVVRVHCKYRAELYFKISRKTRLSRLFNAWTERMESGQGKKVNGKLSGGASAQANGMALANAASPSVASSSPPSSNSMQFVFTHAGRSLEADQTPEEAGIEDGDQILAVEIMDLTDGPGTEEIDEPEPRRQKLKKEWVENPKEAKKTMEEIFDGVVRERLKEVLRQYELRERHFECVIRSKELEVLLSRARAAEQKQLADGEKVRADRLEEENKHIRQELVRCQEQRAIIKNKLLAWRHDSIDPRIQQLGDALEADSKPLVNGTANRPPEGDIV
ncbi:uncharacterized protein LAESUDRAFT_723618 [Laetiporus sulphureus 93-53]|uniref:Ubiquitin-like domain-containing protein n=1 Tax=Laetiporus sulphureus 93-53 TaxID=1314785 RepID=A0A165FBD0_9APHY|nr:uncharacterized protein LAESUDRAFT_723618 [Laetiporus sulphureus 93-53]KZT08709.1 hypothetical protein LAESUDRAFT_723618 [Laetiporus sulphureus 93-53]